MINVNSTEFLKIRKQEISSDQLTKPTNKDGWRSNTSPASWKKIIFPVFEWSTRFVDQWLRQNYFLNRLSVDLLYDSKGIIWLTYYV